jgi:hypothetical protein
MLDTLNQHIELVTGKIHKIYSVDGERIQSIEDLKNDNVLVANDDPFIKVQYNLMAFDPVDQKPGLNGTTMRNQYAALIRPVTQRRKNPLDERKGDATGYKTTKKIQSPTRTPKPKTAKDKSEQIFKPVKVKKATKSEEIQCKF